ncbi:MAG: T9SS type A sorting domain-containing protein [Bacteroidia bacterium]
MLKRIFFFSLTLLMASLVFADNKKGVKKNGDKQDEDKVIVVDSTLVDLDKERCDENDDTLVFEDWDDPNKAPSDNSMIQDGDSESDQGEQSLELPALLDKVTAYREKRYETNFELYPNPATHVLNIQVDDMPERIQVVSLSGASVIEISGLNQIDVSGLQSGIYFVQLVYANHIETKKFVKS